MLNCQRVDCLLFWRKAPGFCRFDPSFLWGTSTEMVDEHHLFVLMPQSSPLLAPGDCVGFLSGQVADLPFFLVCLKMAGCSE
jgi:hypothetical protein